MYYYFVVVSVARKKSVFESYIAINLLHISYVRFYLQPVIPAVLSAYIPRIRLGCARLKITPVWILHFHPASVYLHLTEMKNEIEN